MAGSATLTTVPSMKATPEPSTATTISHRPAADAAGTPRASASAALFSLIGSRR